MTTVYAFKVSVGAVETAKDLQSYNEYALVTTLRLRIIYDPMVLSIQQLDVNKIFIYASILRSCSTV